MLLVDLRCHGESTLLSDQLEGPHNVDSAATDILHLLSELRLFPEVLIGHSFSGKVVMSMAKQFTAAGTHAHRPIHIWALDSLPGEVRGGLPGTKDRPADLISTLMRTPMPISSKGDLIAKLQVGGFSDAVVAWAASSLRPLDPQNRTRDLEWAFDLDGVANMYDSYEKTNM